MTDQGLMSVLGPTAFKLGLQLGMGLVAIVILAALFFASRYGFAWYKKRKSYVITAAIYNPDGTFYIEQIGKFRGLDGIDKMEFINHKDETCPVIDPRYIRSKRVTLWRYAPGQYAVIPPTVWQKMRPEDFKIEVINLQMKNFAFLEQRAAVSRWAYIKDLIQKYAAYITVLLVLIFAGVAIYFIMKTGMAMFSDVAGQRVAECTKLLGITNTPAPPSAIPGV
jgi:hypothetical protein